MNKFEFQSLLYWIGYSNELSECDKSLHYEVSILVVLDWVFKPGLPGPIAYNSLWFQSLLYWIGYSNWGGRLKRGHQWPFQSLLYWIGYSNWRAWN